MSLTREQRLAELQELTTRCREFRNTLPADSPLSGPAFRLAALIGEVKAAALVSSATSSVSRPSAQETK